MIRRITIQNFRSIRRVSVDLEPVTVLVGRSGTGKSNFVAALRFLRNCLTDPSSENQGFSSNTPATKWPGLTRLTVEFDVPGFSGSFVYDLAIHENGPSHPPNRESLAFNGDLLFAQVSSDNRVHWEVEPALVSVPPPGQLILGRLPGLEPVVVAYVTLTAGIGIYNFPFDVLSTPPQPASTSGLSDDGTNYLSVMREIASRLQDTATRRGIAAALQNVNSSVASVELDDIQRPQNAIVAHRYDGKTVTLPLKAESDGFRRFYAHLLALYQSPPKQLLVFEEPENGIYPGALALLADEFKAAPDAGRGQILLTTHSPKFLDHFGPDQIRVVDLVDLETKIGSLADEQREAIEEQLLQSGELLTVDPARIEESAE